jgi:hypothetical protein
MGESVELVVVPERIGRFHKCIVATTGATSRLWPAELMAEEALLLEAEPEFWESSRVSLGEEQAGWPGSVIRGAGAVGQEVRLDRRGLPWTSRSIARAADDYYWHRLAVVFVRPSSPCAPAADWQGFQAQVRASLDPAEWNPPSAFSDLLFAAEGSFACFVSVERTRVLRWMAEQVAGFVGEDYGPLPPHLYAVASWIESKVSGKGVRVWSIDTSSLKSGWVTVTGRWGRGRGLVTTGTARGSRFALQVPVRPTITG